VTHALELRGVVKTYGRRRALNGLDLCVPAGSVFGLVGSNGAGKTTCMAASVGLLRIDAGTIDLLEAGPFDPLRHTGRVALLPQDSHLPPHATAGELLRFYGQLQGLAPAELAGAVQDVLEWTNLVDRRDSRVRTLSHGMARRLTIAQAFLGRPELVLLDEPLSGLDPREVVRIRGLIRERRGRQTIVISSHNLHEIEALCDRVAFIEAGRLVEQNTLAEIVRRDHTITYTLQASALTAAALQPLAPALRCELTPDGTALVVAFDGTGATHAEVNARVLRCLLDAGVGITEVRCGSKLESQYMQATGERPRQEKP